jgi:osmoprotectant transport system substrate-binding protein
MLRVLAALAAMLAGILAVSGCAGIGPVANAEAAGPLANIHLAGASFRVGSKEFTEQLILGQIALQALLATGADVDDETGIQGSSNVRTALLSDEIDMYWEYTGTAWTTLLGHEPSAAPKDSAALFHAVATEDLARNHVKWLPPAPLNDTYAIATEATRADRLNVHSLSDYARLANTDPTGASMCVASEFLTRDDGWPGVQKAYGLNLPANLVHTVDLGVIYTQIPSGAVCKFGEVTTTDARVPANHLVVLNDDKHFFVLYNAALTIRADVFRRFPRLAAVFNPISAKLTDEVMRDLDYKVDVAGELPEEVAHNWLLADGFVR